jgi:hypothetical protein
MTLLVSRHRRTAGIPQRGPHRPRKREDQGSARCSSRLLTATWGLDRGRDCDMHRLPARQAVEVLEEGHSAHKPGGILHTPRHFAAIH